MTLGPVGALARIQRGLRGACCVGSTFIGMRATLSAPRRGTPASIFVGGILDEELTVLIDSMLKLFQNEIRGKFIRQLKFQAAPL